MRSSCGVFSRLVIKGGGPIVGGAIPGLVVLDSIREHAEQARGSKPVRNIAPWPLHQLLLPDLLVFQS
jgi:CO dehydrogenase/acetyl-CoA synthase alpha subunit